MAGFEPARTKYNGLAIHRLNHSATVSVVVQGFSVLMYSTLPDAANSYFFDDQRHKTQKNNKIKGQWAFLFQFCC